MIRLNRGRVIGILLTVFIVYFLFLSSANTNSDFRKRTEEGLSRRHGVLQGDLSDEEFRAQTNEKLDEILAKKGQKPLRASDEGAGRAPPKIAPKPIEEQRYADDTSADKFSGASSGRRERPRYPKDKQDSVKKVEDKEVGTSDKDKTEDKESTKAVKSTDPAKDIAREKLQEYLKKPLVIFSKSYCPHSKRAKHLLLELYKITPTPIVVELDQLTQALPKPHSSTSNDDEEDESHPPTLGQKLQELLGEISGRRTVPNVMVGGTKSIGGNDLIWQMHEEGTLAKKIQELAGKRITGIELLDPEKHGDAKR